MSYPFAPFKKVALTGLCALFVSSYIHAAPAQLIDQCDSCHGKGGVSQHTDIPTIAGIAQWNLVDQMLQYQDGRIAKSVNPVTGNTSTKSDMNQALANLTEADMEALADHYSALKFVPAAQTFDAKQAALGKSIHDKACASCHSDGGAVAEDEASILAGQHKGYLAATFEQYKLKQRSTDKKMQKSIDKLSDAEVAALVNYYASLQ